MGKNHRKQNTITSSVSFQKDVLAAINARVQTERTDRSAYLNACMEHILGIKAHPEFIGRSIAFVADPDLQEGKPGLLVRRPAHHGASPLKPAE